MKKDFELKAKTQLAKSTVFANIPEAARSNWGSKDSERRTSLQDYSAVGFLDTYDEPADGCELEYTMDTGMVSPEKSQEGFVPSFLYRTIYRDRKVLLGFEARRVEKTFVENERKWVFYPPAGKFIMTTKKVVRTISYLNEVPVYKWIQVPTLRAIGCYLNHGKVVGSSTVVTRKDRKFGQDKREVDRQTRRHGRVLIAQDEIDARKQVASAIC